MSNPARNRITLHVDMDSFYSSVEVRERPELKGLPVVVGSDPKEGKGRGVVSTCSYEAREFGIHSAMPISRAYKLCPDAVYLPVNMKLYKEVSENIMDLIRIFADRFQQVSVDEAYLDVGNGIDDYESATLLARKIKDEVLRKQGLTCSIGVAPNKILAKIASDFDKPDGLTVIRPEDVESFLFPLPVSKIPGIGKKTRLILEDMDTETVGDLASMDVQLLVARFGKSGVVMHQLANGIDLREVREREEVKSISTEDTFEEDIFDPAAIRNVFFELTDKVHESLSRKRFRFRTVTIKVRFEDFRTYTRAKTLQAASTDKQAIIRTALGLMDEFIGKGRFRLLGVGVTKLEKIDERQTLLNDFF
ncbi:DNA polymerase IV [Methanolobus zinderi]|uniref:DNA polymerase IV n=1 Tax=Methanolobus zinderi TaxID=536044 RepID=A0A7D5I7G6_9EURY|nr:DNA polymerase IV [Methanolobus zinderi]KXS43650.1 MAG: DNA-directed DNA polymerase [Methanolobus sp. T82-4]QLC49082.1 DNA polymerase IV [Methanolobus zinderi]